MSLSLTYVEAAIFGCVLLLGSSGAAAQEDSAKPKPAARVYPPLVAGSGDQDMDNDKQSPDNLTPDTRPLTGVQTPTLGSPELRHSYWMPGFQYSNLVRSDSLYQPTTPNLNTTSY